MERYDPQAIEAKWQRVWAEEGAFTVPNPDPDELERHDNPLKVDGLLPRPAPDAPALDDVTSW